jgi:hypothetical protein
MFMKNTLETRRKIYIVLLAAILVSHFATAQYSERYIPIGYIGLEANVGTRAFGLTSTNIPELNQLKVSEEGVNLGLLAGNEAVIGKLKFGLYRSARLVREKINMQEGDLAINVFPLYILNVKSKLLKPYALVAFGLNNLQFHGSYSLPAPPPMPAQHSECECEADPTLPGCTDEASTEEPQEEDIIVREGETRYLGSIVVSKFDFGGGVQVHMAKRNKYFNMFAEVKYGLPVGTKSKDQAFRETKISNFMIVNVGISMGIRH